MTATNHAVFGALTVAVVSNPLLALPLALASHFALDALPHFGAHAVAEPNSKEFNGILLTDAFLTTAFILIVTFAGIRAGWTWWLLPLGAILGALPDLMWVKHYQNDLHEEEKQWDRMRSWHKRIQNWELSWGWTIEIVWFVITVAVLSDIIFK